MLGGSADVSAYTCWSKTSMIGAARPLDFGHWSAHKLEQLSEYRIRHGEAVAIGIALDVIYSKQMGFLDAHSAERILRLMEDLGFELFTPELFRQGSRGELLVLAGVEEFREHLGGELHITQLRGIGRSFEVTEMDEAVVLESIDELRTAATAQPRSRSFGASHRRR